MAAMGIKLFKCIPSPRIFDLELSKRHGYSFGTETTLESNPFPDERAPGWDFWR